MNIVVYGVNMVTGSKICQVFTPREDRDPVRRVLGFAHLYQRLAAHPIEWRFFEVESEDRAAHAEVFKRYGVAMF